MDAPTLQAWFDMLFPAPFQIKNCKKCDSTPEWTHKWIMYRDPIDDNKYSLKKLCLKTGKESVRHVYDTNMHERV